MTQVSSNTLAYDQIYLKLRQFYLKEMNNQFKSRQDRLEEYNKILAELHQSIMGPLAKFDPFIKGEPPFSEKFNKFSSDFTTDINTAAKQIDYVNAKLINGFNLFSQEIENEKKYVERIISKARILQMYNQSPSNDLVYYGDSFENSDKIDITKISVGRNPLIFNGMMTLPLFAKSNLKISRTNIEPSNGFMGNNHKVIRSTNSDNTSTYKYVFEGSPGMSTASNVSDSNPLTYFEYEAINVDKTTSNSYEFMSENEFCYITNSQVNTGLANNQFINWSNKDISSPLLLKVSFQSLTSEYVNNINIIPYFGSSQLIKVNQINIYNKNGMLENVLDIPIYIGSSFAPFDINIANNYFYNKANVKFSERQVSKVEIIFEQESFSDIQIQHVYWSPTDISANGPLRAMPRFNPDKLSSNLYQKIEYDKNALVPKISSPNQYKASNTAPKPIRVTLEPKPIILSGYAVSFRVKETTGTNVMIDPKWRNINGLKVYFYAWDQDLYLQWSEEIVYTNSQFTSRVYANEDECEAERQRIAEYFSDELVNYILPGPTGASWTLSVIPESIMVEEVSKTINIPSQTYHVEVKRNLEILNAKRMCIGIRDISMSYETYQNAAEMVSTPYLFDSNVDSVMLSIESDVDNTFADKVSINSYISVEDGKWIRISPIQMDSRGIAEVISFNQNISESAKLPGVAYLNYPEVPKDIRKISVKIEIDKDSKLNVTPKIYSYKLITKVKK